MRSRITAKDSAATAAYEQIEPILKIKTEYPPPAALVRSFIDG